MHSSGDSNSVPVRVHGSTWSTAISVHSSSEASSQDNAPLNFQVHLYDDYRDNAVLPDLPDLTGDTRWITINTLYGRTYKIEMVNDGEGFLLDRGWRILVAVENLQAGQTLDFEQDGVDIFNIWVHTPPTYPPPVGLSPARIPSPGNAFGLTHLVVDSGTQMNETVLQAVQRVWNASSINGPVYVCRLRDNPAGNNSLVFNKVYSYLIPEDSEHVAMQFIGSNTIIPGAMRTYANRKTHMEREWPLYVAEHNLASGEVFICKIHRGPAIWEFIGFCAGRA